MTLDVTQPSVSSSRWPCGSWCVVETSAGADRYLTSLMHRLRRCRSSSGPGLALQQSGPYGAHEAARELGKGRRSA